MQIGDTAFASDCSSFRYGALLLMIENQDIVCVAPQRWESLLRRRQQIMSRLSLHNNRIIYVSVCLERWRDNIMSRLSWLMAYPPEVVERQPHVYEFSLFNILPNRLAPYGLASWANNVLIKPALKYLAQQFDISRPILWFTFPALPGACRQLEPRLIVYDCSDRWPECFWKDERILLKQANVVFATAHSLLEDKRGLNPNVHLVPNAVDVEIYRRALLPETSIPSDVANLPKPIIGLMGAINDKVDVSLLEKLAQAHSDWSVVLVGPIFSSEVPIQILERLSNLHMLGYRKPTELPGYLKAFDVALIAYVLDERTAAIDPLKLYEYLAAGKPVVATALPELSRFRRVVRVASGVGDFICQVEQALLEEDVAGMVQQRLEAVKEHTWNQRVATMARLIEPLL